MVVSVIIVHNVEHCATLALRTSRNVTDGLLTDWFLDGLDYRIEHHLLPARPGRA